MKKTILSIGALLFATTMFADEGMWLLTLLKKQNIKEMQSMGMKLSADDIYSANKSSLKDAIVVFGGGCTGEVVSPEGLVLTNHHCGYGSIQALSSVEHDYLKNGYWAMNNAEEIPSPGLSVRFVREIKDITDIILKGVKPDMSEEERNKLIEENAKKYAEKQPSDANHYTDISEMFGGNQFFAFVMEVYTDIRFVGAPPSSIGKFGGETDNWMWPRHTGDFSVFRIYAAPDGTTPADYAADNVPYSSPVHLNISTQGYSENDFAMIMGFPGSTERYMTSFEIEQMLTVDNPNRIKIRTEREEILKSQMLKSDKVRIQYSSKFASSSNYRKNSIGMSRGIEKLDVKGKKEAIQEDFTAWVNGSAKRQAKYGTALDLIKSSVEELTPIQSEMQILSEAVLRSVEVVNAARRLVRFKPDTPIEEIIAFATDYYKDYDEETDRLVAVRMFELLREMLPDSNTLPFLVSIDTNFGGDVKAYVDNLYETSAFASHDKFVAAAADMEALKNDPAAQIGSEVVARYSTLRRAGAPINSKFEEGHRKLIAGLMEMSPKAKHYPDANFTMRLTYGSVLPYSPADGVEYRYYTTLKGVIDKEDPKNPVEFTVPDYLKGLYAAKEFGPYADPDGTLHTCFLTTNDITGGNSGSPVLNASGELIGLAFDGNWEAMSGDIAFEPDLQRCINVDIRYVLFIMDKFGGAGWLLNEMTLR